MFQTSILISAVIASAAIIYAQAPPAAGRGAAQPATQTIMMIKPDLYIVTGAGGNSTVRVTKAGVILVDTKNLGDQFYNGLVEQIKTVTKEPVKEVIITHVHQDHSGNTGKFIEAGAQVIANEGEKAEVATYTSPAGKPAPPSMTPPLSSGSRTAPPRPHSLAGRLTRLAASRDPQKSQPPRHPYDVDDATT